MEEQAERMIADPNVRCENPMFGQYQHPEMVGMFGLAGTDEFRNARDRWLWDVRHRIFLSPLELLAECAEPLTK